MLKYVKVMHTFRETNSCADKLAKVGIVCVQDMEFREEILEFIYDLVSYK